MLTGILTTAGILTVGVGMDLVTRKRNEQKAAAKRANDPMGDRSGNRNNRA